MVEIDKKNYTLSEVIDFVTNGEDSSNVDSDREKEIVILPPTERAEAETDCDSDVSDDKNEGNAHHMPRRLLTAPCSTNIVKQNLDEAIKLVMINHASHFLRDRNKRRKTESGKKLTLTVIMILLIQKNYQQNYQAP